MATINQVCAVVLVSSVVFLARGTAYVTDSDMYEELEKALVANTTNLYNLQNTFYPPDPMTQPPDKVKILVTVTFYEPEDDYCGYECDRNIAQSKCICSLETYYWTTSAQTNLQYNLKRVIHGLYPIFGIMQWDLMEFVQPITGDYGDGGIFGDYPPGPPGSTVPSTNVNITIWLELNTTSDMYRDYSDACLSLLVWVKGYARAHGKPTQRMEEDKGFVSTFRDGSGNNVFNLGADDLKYLLLGLQLSAYVTFSLLVAKFLHQIFQKMVTKIRPSTYGYSLYWSTAYITGMYNVAKLWELYLTLNYPSIGLCIVGCQVVFSMFELAIAWRATRHYSQAPTPPMPLANVCCCCWVFCCCSRYKSRFIHTLALVNIIWFSHSLLTGLIIVPFLVILHVATTIIAVTLYVLMLITVTLVIFSIVHIAANFTRGGTSNAPSVFSKAFNAFINFSLIVLTLSIIVLTMVLYTALVSDGLNTAATGNVALALVPPVLLTTAGYFVRKKLLGDESAERLRREGDKSATGEVETTSPGDAAIDIPEERNQDDPLIN